MTCALPKSTSYSVWCGCILLQLITWVNKATEDVVMSQYVLTDGVDSTTFALTEGHGREKVRIP